MEQDFLHRAMFLKEHSEEIEKKIDFIGEQISELQRLVQGWMF